jgi:hypothetical protein
MAAVVVVAAITGCAAYLSESTAQSIPIVGSLHLPLVIAAVVFVSFIPLGMRHWWLGIAMFLAWLPFEDLFRKFNGNALEIYAVKDVLFLFALVSAAPKLREANAWRRSLGSARIPTLILIGWAVALSALPIFDADWRQSIIALHLDFLYLPLVGIGFLIGINHQGANRAIKWLAVFAAAVLAIGLVQAVVGPTFLNPGTAAAGLGGAAQYRGGYLVGGRGVFIPTGTFVDPGRFAQLAELAVALVLAWLVARRPSKSRAVPAIAGLTILAAVWASGSRAVLVIAAALVVIAVVAGTSPAERVKRLIGGAIAGFAAILVISFAFPSTFSATRSWYTQTLDPRSGANEWAFRWNSYTGGVATGLKRGGLVGRGTGDQSLGKQYLYGGEERKLEGLYALESGYGGVIAEWGVVGLALWVTWVYVWMRRLRRSCQRLSGPTHGVALVLSGWIATVLVIQFFAGFQFFQNYFINAYLWLLSGIVFGLAAGATNNDERVVAADQLVLHDASA